MTRPSARWGHEFGRRVWRVGSVVASAALGAGCGKTLGPDDLARIDFAAGNAQTAVVATPVDVPPAVRALDLESNPIPGVSVTFEVIEGDGAITGGTATTGADGVAAVGSWTLGARAGDNVLRATAPGAPRPVEFRATAVVGPPAIVEQLEGDGTVATAGLSPAIQPRVRVTDALDNAVRDVDVSFEVGSGGGTVATASVTTDANGEAAAVDWVLGSVPGLNTLVASVAGISATFTATGVPGPASLTLADGAMQSATVGSAVPVAPRVRLTDALDLPTPDVAVVFQIVAGGGVVSSDTVVSDANGEASVEWTLGPITGANTLVASAGELTPVTFEADGLPDAPALLDPVSGAGQFGAVNEPLAFAPAVRVTDRFGNPVPGAAVTFAVIAGGGSLTGAMTMSDDDGIADALSWTLGPAEGDNTLEVTTPGVPAVTITATALAAVFDIEFVQTGGGGGRGIAEALFAASRRWESIIVGDLPSVSFADNPVDSLTCGGNPIVNDEIDDVRIFIRLVPIDGAFGTLGSAGPCITRDEGGLPVMGAVRIDTDDIDRLASQGRLADLVIHEMGHVLGVGTLWDTLLVNPSLPNAEGADTHFAGPRAIAAFDAIGGAGFARSKVPVENTQGEQGTRDSHWRETVFRTESMTGFLNDGDNPVSLVTIESLGDLGYRVNPVNADPFVIPNVELARGLVTTDIARGMPLENDIRSGTIYSVRRDGRVTAIIRR